MTPEKQLQLISKAWGRQRGYCFFPWISGVAEDKTDRIQSYREGPAFKWPADKEKIIAHMREHQGDDLYWCPSLFETPTRRLDQAMDEHALWADLDGVDPRTIKDYEPTIAWETSPGRFQALWVVQGDIQGSSWPGRENQCLTYHVGADVGGWDTTQLLRIPGWRNHKPEYRQRYGEAPEGRLLWSDGRVYLPDEFNSLPDVPGAAVVNEVLEEEVNRIDRFDVWGRVRLAVSKRVRELVTAREAVGDRSDALWEIERELADAGCTIAEIVCVVRATVWNKFAGRGDELKRLSTEASKAVAARSDQTIKKIELELEAKPPVQNLFDIVRNLPPPKWLVKNIITEGSCGFVAGQPKSFKSWTSFDLALSIATGTPFLGHFDVVNPGPVLYIQEEDAAAMVKQRLEKIYPAKLQDKITTINGELIWNPASREDGPPPIDAYIGNGFTISNPAWQSWLDDTMSKSGYRMVLLDPLMMIAGDVEENRAQEMTEKIFKPMKQLSRKHNCCMVVVHHMKKSDPRAPQRGGQLMLGSVANHAWGEDSMYLKIGRGGDIIVEQESKHANVKGFRITHLRNQKWEPQVIQDPEEEEREPDGVNGQVRKATPKAKSKPKIIEALEELGQGFHSTQVIAEKSGVKPNTAFKQLQRQAEAKVIQRNGGTWALK